MANKSENAEIAVLQNQMIDVKNSLTRIENKLDGLDNKYALKEDVKRLKWQTVPLTVLLTAAITALVYYFINSQGIK